MPRSIVALLLVLSLALDAQAAAPTTLGYQGRLADAGGQPVSSTLQITFRLYDVASGGSPLWTEVQPAVDVDGGNLAVQLGSVTPLPAGVWGQQLYLGVQVAGDSEMLPRPPLTATPFALRAAGTMKNTLHVSAEGTAGQNGAALLAAMAGVTASAISPVSLELDAGTFDLGTARLEVPSYVTLSGRGQEATLVTSAHVLGTVTLASHAHARRLTARNTGIPEANASAYGIGAHDAVTFGPVADVSLQDVTGESIAAPGTPGSRHGIRLCTQGGRLIDSVGRAEGGSFSTGLRADCSTDLSIDGVRLFSSGSTLGLRGAYLLDRGRTSNLTVTIEANGSAETIFGVRVFSDGQSSGHHAFEDLAVAILGSDLAAPSVNTLEAVRIENLAAVRFDGLDVTLDRTKALYAAGVRVNADDTMEHIVSMVDANIDVATLKEAADAFGTVMGIRLQGAVLEARRSRIRVTCLAGSNANCSGISRSGPAGPPNTATLVPQAGTVVLDQVSIDVDQEAPSAPGAQLLGVEGIGAVRIMNSSLRVQLSTSDEIHSTVALNSADADFRVVDSTIELVHPLENSGCVLRGSAGVLELFNNHIQGHSCADGATLVCAGNTKRGAGLLAGTCP